ncbi:CoA pyrophosphatase [Candidatus Actinomarina]|nr:CoA pyrophosphatase [Candidatus Actinomarina sp.]
MKLNLSYEKLKIPYSSYNQPYAAVSILIHKEREILFIKRSNDMPTHKGHIAFPGGKKELNDSSIVDTAVREASEELLITKNNVEPFGILEPVDTIEFKFNVFPVLCNLKKKPESFNKKEVQDIFFVPIDDLSNQQNWRFRGIYPNDWIFKIDNETLWGATAKMTRDLFRLT